LKHRLPEGTSSYESVYYRPEAPRTVVRAFDCGAEHLPESVARRKIWKGNRSMSILRKAAASVALTLSMAAIAGATVETNILTFSSTNSATQPVITFNPNTPFPDHSQGAGNLGKIYSSNSANWHKDPVEFSDLTNNYTGYFHFYAWMDNTTTTTSVAGGYRINFVDGYIKFEEPVLGGTTWAEGNFGSGYLEVIGSNMSFHVNPGSWTSYYAPALLPSGDGFYNFSFDVVNYSNLPGSSGGPYSYFSSTGDNGLLTSAPVPEPGEWAAMGILASGLTGLMIRARRRK